jgi:hypothetical protein
MRPPFFAICTSGWVSLPRRSPALRDEGGCPSVVEIICVLEAFDNLRKAIEAYRRPPRGEGSSDEITPPPDTHPGADAKSPPHSRARQLLQSPLDRPPRWPRRQPPFPPMRRRRAIFAIPVAMPKSAHRIVRSRNQRPRLDHG